MSVSKKHRKRVPWTEEDVRVLRELYPRHAAPEIARLLGRTAANVYRAVARFRLTTQRRMRWTPQAEQTLRDKHAEGLTDTEIAPLLGCDRHAVGKRRRRLGLPDNAFHERRRARVRERTAAQLRAAGLSSMGQLRAEAYRRYARECGWPDDVRPRGVQILNALAAAGGPLTRRQIADAVGVPWKCTRNSLASNDAEGSYLAHLAARGLVTRLAKACTVRNQGKGASRDLYTLGPAALALLQERACRNPERA